MILKTKKLGDAVKNSLTLFTVFIFLISSVSAIAADEQTNGSSFEGVIKELNSKSFKNKSDAIEKIAASGHERVQPILEAMLGGDLYADKKTQEIVIGAKHADGYEIVNAVDGKTLGVVKKRSIKKIRINNALRTKLRGVISRIQFTHPDPDVRANAVKQLTGSMRDDDAVILQEILVNEKSNKVIEEINTALALHTLSTADDVEKLTAIETLRGSLNQSVRTALSRISQDSESSIEVKNAANEALDSIQDKVTFYGRLETVFFGLSLGSILVLSAIGLAITFGVMGVINMAHGELMMLGAYTTYVIQTYIPNSLEYSLFLAVPAAFLVAAIVGIIIERGIIRHLYGRPLETLLATFGVSLILQQAVRTIFSPLNRSVSTPEWMSGSWEINSVLSLTYNRLYILLFSFIVFLLLVAIMRYTRLGLEVRAVSQNRAMAKCMGIKSEWVDAMTFGLGSGIAGVAGVALSQLTNVGPNLGQAYIVDSFMVVVFGGVGNIWGTLVSGMSLGVVNKFLEPYAGAVMAKILILVFIILFIQKRPRGLFPQKGRAAEG